MTILTSFRNPRDRQALVTSFTGACLFCLSLRLFHAAIFAASNWGARASNIVCRGAVTSALNWELWSRAYLLFVKILGEILSSHGREEGVERLNIGLVANCCLI
jgi:hypothetical protein